MELGIGRRPSHTGRQAGGFSPQLAAWLSRLEPRQRRIAASANANEVESFAYVRDLLVQLSERSPPTGVALLPDAWLTAHPRSLSVLVEVAGLSGTTKSKTSDLTAMRHFEFRDELIGISQIGILRMPQARNAFPQKEPFLIWSWARLTRSKSSYILSN